MKKYLLLITTSLFTHIGNTQVLLSEDFNSYAPGHLNTDYTGTTAGQGGWVTKRHANAIATAMVTPETGKGNVITFTTNGNFSNEYITIQQNTSVISALWNNRTAGNDVLKFEYEVYGSGFFIANGGLLDQSLLNFMTLSFTSTSTYSIRGFYVGSGFTNQILKNYTATTFPHNSWHKVELFIDYNIRKAYFYIPTLNLFRVDDITSASKVPHSIYVQAQGLKIGSIVKYDNIKLTALPSVPNYILSANELVSAIFNMYPNPATNMVNITNSENMLVEQVTVYDITGKQLTTQNYNNETQIQLNIENLANGTYMLHIQTNAGLAVKKLVKK